MAIPTDALDALGLTREDMADIARKRDAHLQRLIGVANEAVEHVRHAPECPGIKAGDSACTCGAVEFLERLGLAIRNVR